MTVTTVRCDRCGKAPALPLSVPLGTRYNGTDTDTLSETVDLCHPCAMVALGAFTARGSVDDRQVWIDGNTSWREKQGRP